MQLLCGDSEGLDNDPRCTWSLWEEAVLMRNVYCKRGLGLTDQNLDYIKAIAEAIDQGRRCVLAFGDWNITPDELEASGILEGFGLDIVIPTNSDITCTAGQGSMIDYLIVTKGYSSPVRSCEVVREAPCGTNLGSARLSSLTQLTSRSKFFGNPSRCKPRSLTSPKEAWWWHAGQFPRGSKLGLRPTSMQGHKSMPIESLRLTPMSKELGIEDQTMAAVVGYAQ